MSIFQIILLAVVQGLAELLPVSSSAHVVVAEKLMGLNPSAPEMTLLLVMLHTGTMFAVIAYFWKAWMKTFFASATVFKQWAARLIVATLLTGIVGYPLMKGIEFAAEKAGYVTKDETGHANKVEIEMLFGNLELVSAALLAAGILILIAGLSKRSRENREIDMRSSGIIGAIQGLCLPFRGFSRSGATISTGLLLGCAKTRVEEFSFAPAPPSPPAAIGREALRLFKHNTEATPQPLHLAPLLAPGLLGLVFSFFA